MKTENITDTKIQFEKALKVARPDNIKKLFPNSKALIVSGKYVDIAMREKGKSVAMAVNGRNPFIIEGALKAAQRANCPIIIEIAKSEGGRSAYCPVNYWNIAAYVDQLANQYGVTIPIAVHADHYGIKKQSDVEQARVEIPSMFDAGITSIAIDASHMPDAENLKASIELFTKYVPDWAGKETEVGEIKGDQGLSTPEDAVFVIKGLNAHNVYPEWIALNNGTVHGLEATGGNIHVELTAQIHNELKPYGVSGAQHGTSGNNYAKLAEITQKTSTTKANVATALQMISWGLKVNEFGNAERDTDGNFIKVEEEGVSEELWAEIVKYAKENNYKAEDYKNINIIFQNKMASQPKEIRDRMVKRVEDFIFNILINVFNAKDTAPLAIKAMIKANSPNPGQKAKRIEDPSEWTQDMIDAKAALIGSDKGAKEDFDD